MTYAQRKVMSWTSQRPPPQEGAHVRQELAVSIGIAGRRDGSLERLALGDYELEITVGLEAERHHRYRPFLDVELNTRTLARLSVVFLEATQDWLGLGDIQVVQNFVALADLAEFDPAELLAPYTGDIAAEGISKAMRGGAKFLHHGIKRQQRYVAEAITEEWRMAPGPLEVAWFAEETAAVERAVDALTKRLEKLEAK